MLVWFKKNFAAGQNDQSPKARVDAYVELQQEETLHLKFKTFSSDVALNRDDRKMLAKAICGLSNAEGGQLVVGIETKRLTAWTSRFEKNRSTALSVSGGLSLPLCPRLLSPQHRGISIARVLEDEGQRLSCYRRAQLTRQTSHVGSRETVFPQTVRWTRVLDHAEIRELMLAPREGRMEIKPTLRITKNAQWRSHFGPHFTRRFSAASRPRRSTISNSTGAPSTREL